MPSGLHGLTSHRTEDLGVGTGHREEADLGLRHVEGPLATPRGPAPLSLAPCSLCPLRSHCQLVIYPILSFSSRFFLSNALSRPLLHPAFSLGSAVSASLPSNHVLQGLSSAWKNPWLLPANPEAELKPSGCSLSRYPVGRKHPHPQKHSTAWHSPASWRGVGGAQHGGTLTCGSEPPGLRVGGKAEGWPPGPASSSISFSSPSREPWISRDMVSNSCLSWGGPTPWGSRGVRGVGSQGQ